MHGKIRFSEEIRSKIEFLEVPTIEMFKITRVSIDAPFILK